MTLGEPVIVVGAGIAGLVAALSLAEAGFRVSVFERAARLEAAGAGIQLSPNALRVLARLGLKDTLLESGVSATSVTLRSARTGRAIAEIPVHGSDGTAYLSIHRADLQSALLSAVAANDSISLTLGKDCFGLARADGRIAVAFRSDGPSGQDLNFARVVVAADGVGSSVARSLGHGAARPSGAVAWRMTIPAADQAGGRRSGIEAWLGPARHAVSYPVRAGRDTNLVLIGKSSDVEAAIDAGAPAAKRTLLARFAGWDPRLLALVEAAGPATAWPLRTSDRRPFAQDMPGVLLIGDAAHAMLPYAAQGAAMAIEDGWTIASALRAAGSVEEAFARYERDRRQRLRQVRRRVAFHRFVYHLPFPFSSARDVALGLRPREALARDLGWLYDWLPPTLGSGPTD